MNKKIKYIINTLVIILILASGIVGFIKYKQSKETVAETKPENKIEENIMVIGIDDKKNEQTEQNQTPDPEPEPEPEPEDASTLTQKLYNMNTEIGTVYIPKTKLTTKVYSNPDPKKMDKMPALLYTSGGLNQPGITLIVGHNRRNGKIFSKNKKLEEGDVFYFTDYEGNEKEYTIYSKFTTTSEDTSFLNTNVDVPTIALSCCTDASDDNRIIILGRAE